MVMMRDLHTYIISKELIMPSSPTPSHLKLYNLSFSDNFSPPVYIPLVFFYPYSGSSTTITNHQEKSTNLLRKSLSQTLTYYYPFSGRLIAAKDGSYVDCNDEGVEFFVARAKALLSEVVDAHYQTQDSPFFPKGTVWDCPYVYNSLVKIQLTYFECGGLALSVCLSHKIGDTCTLCTFIRHWAVVCNNLHRNPLPDNEIYQQVVNPPNFISSPKCAWPELAFNNGKNYISKRFLFPNVKIQQLKAEIIEAQSPKTINPTRVEAVNSLLYCCAVKAARATKLTRSFKLFVLAQTVNMRKRLVCPLEETTVGNFSWCLQVPAVLDRQLALNSLTARIQEVKRKLAGMTIAKMNWWQMVVSYANKYLPPRFYDYYICTSMIGYQLYEIDFGWGKPARATLPCPGKFFILMDRPANDGIEAVVSLEEEAMAKFQANEQLLQFAYAA